MANSDTPFGLRPVMHKSGAPYNASGTPYYIPSSYGTALYIGDPVVKTGTSNTANVSVAGVGSWGVGMLAEINRATVGDGNVISGVIVGFAGDQNSKRYNPASTERVAFVCDDPDVLFEIQADGTIAATDIGLNAVLIATHAGSNATGYSGMELDTTSDVPAADASNQLLIKRIANTVGNDPAAANVKVLVQINNHSEAHGALGL